MSKESFGRALEAMVNDADAAANFGHGDFGQLANQDLTPAEQALLQAAAAEMPDVSGFGESFLKLGYIGETEKNILKLGDIGGDFGPRFREASDYYQYKLKD